MAKLFVGRIDSRAINESVLTRLFEKYGHVKEVTVLKNYAFIHMANDDDADVAIKCLDNTELKGCNITVSWSHSRKNGADRTNRSFQRGSFDKRNLGRRIRDRRRSPQRSYSPGNRSRYDNRRSPVSRKFRRSPPDRSREMSPYKKVIHNSRSRSISPRDFDDKSEIIDSYSVLAPKSSNKSFSFDDDEEFGEIYDSFTVRTGRSAATRNQFEPEVAHVYSHPQNEFDSKYQIKHENLVHHRPRYRSRSR